MKKTLLSVAVACLVFVLSSCSKTPAEKAIAIIEDATEQVEKAKSQEDLTRIGLEMLEKSVKLEEEYKKENGDKEYEPTKEEEKAMEEAMKKFDEACEKKAEELAKK